MTKFMIYLFEYEPAQTITTKSFDGEHWYMASDICRLIGIAGYSAAVLRHLNYDEYRKETTYIGGYGKKHVLLINNSGVIRLIRSVKGNRKIDAIIERTYKIPPAKLPEHQQYLIALAA